MNQEEEEEQPEPQGLVSSQLSFEELLKQFDQPKKKALSRREAEEVNGMDDEFIPATDSPSEKMEELNQYYSELDDDKFKITEEDLKDHRDDDFKLKKKRSNRYANLLKDPHHVKDLFVASELFSRKF